MIGLARLKGMMRPVLHLGDSPRRTALAFAIGVLIAFSPFYGLHTASVFLLAWALRLNLVAMLAGSFINNPWTVLPILATSLWVGLTLIPLGAPPQIDWHQFTVQVLLEQLRPFVVPFVVGCSLLGLLAALLAYAVAYLLILRFRERQEREKRLAPPPLSC